MTALNPMHAAPRCGAKTRSGSPCRAPAIRGKRRCRMHGGRSCGARTAEGRAAQRAAHTKHGLRSREFARLRAALINLARAASKGGVCSLDCLQALFVANTGARNAISR